MNTIDTSETLLIYLVWVHAAIFAVPMMIYTMKLEWDEAREHRTTARKRKVLRAQTTKPAPVPV